MTVAACATSLSISLVPSLVLRRRAPLPELHAVEDEVGKEGELDGLGARVGGRQGPEDREGPDGEGEGHPAIRPEEQAGAPGQKGGRVRLGHGSVGAGLDALHHEARHQHRVRRLDRLHPILVVGALGVVHQLAVDAVDGVKVGAVGKAQDLRAGAMRASPVMQNRQLKAAASAPGVSLDKGGGGRDAKMHAPRLVRVLAGAGRGMGNDAGTDGASLRRHAGPQRGRGRRDPAGGGADGDAHDNSLAEPARRSDEAISMLRGLIMLIQVRI